MNKLSGFSSLPYFGANDRKAALDRLRQATEQRNANLDRRIQDEYVSGPGEDPDISAVRRQTYKKLIINSQYNTTRKLE